MDKVSSKFTLPSSKVLLPSLVLPSSVSPTSRVSQAFLSFTLRELTIIVLSVAIAFLAQSPQLAKQMCIAADMEKVYEIGPGKSEKTSFESFSRHSV